MHFLSDWPPNPNAKKREIAQTFPFPISLLLFTLSQRYLLWLSVRIFPNDMEGSKRTTTCTGYLCSSTKKNKQKKQKKIQSYDSKFVVKPNCTKLQQNTPNCFKIIMTSTRGNNMWPLTQNWNNDSHIQENQGVQTTCSYNPCCVSLKYGCVTCDSKGAKAATFGVNVHYSWHLIKP